MLAEVLGYSGRNGLLGGFLQLLCRLGLLQLFLSDGDESVVPAEFLEAVDEAGKSLVAQLVEVDIAEFRCEHRAYSREVEPLVLVFGDEVHDRLSYSRFVVFVLHLAYLVEIAEMVAADRERARGLEFAYAHDELARFSQTDSEPREIAVAGD